MNIYKIAGLIAVALAIIAAFVNIPYAALILAAIGLVIGWNVQADAHVRVIVSALALRAFSGAFNDLPAVGGHVTTILANVATVLTGIAVLVILRNIYKRLRE